MSDRKRVQMTVAVFYDDQKILLALKKRGFGKGWYNGLGGKVKTNETLRKAARREAHEEARILIGSLEKFGIIDFEFENKPEKVLEVHFFRILKYFGKPLETEEMRPEWFCLDEIPYDSMFPADRFLFPYLLRKEKFKGRVKYNSQMSGLLEKEVGIVKKL